MFLRSLRETLVLAQSPKLSALHTRHRSLLSLVSHLHSIALSLSPIILLSYSIPSSPLFVFIHTSLCVFLFHDTIFRQIPTMLMRILFCYMLYFLSFGRYLWFSPSRIGSLVVDCCLIISSRSCTTTAFTASFNQSHKRVCRCVVFSQILNLIDLISYSYH